MGLFRVLRASGATLTHTFRVGETATDATGAVTVAVARLDGTPVQSGAATHPAGQTGVYTFALNPVAQLDALTVTWSGTIAGAARAEQDLVEVVGGFLFEVADLRTEHQIDPTRYPTAVLEARRVIAEVECEDICGVAFVPRFRRVAVDSRGCRDLLLPDAEVRTVRAVSAGGTVWPLAGVTASTSGVLASTGAPWPAGRVVVEYEHGLDGPPPDLIDAVMLRAFSMLGRAGAAVPQRAITWSAAEGGTYRLALPGARKTGIPDVDGPYERHTLDVGGFA
ncbi:hypothetical protein [Micromonospora sp. NPDC004551]|uniref:hypothetical protein n=1 Tax=Micromonospora sp. NPDC004551 TaxID=3154284 RepID=UPI0033A0845F